MVLKSHKFRTNNTRKKTSSIPKLITQDTWNAICGKKQNKKT